MNEQLALFEKSRPKDLLVELGSFSDFGKNTLVEMVDGIQYFINEFWTARQRQAHRLHEVSYRACFKPQLPAFFIDRLTEPGDIVYDPFMGRGTTPIEAALKGRVPYGNDTNPLSLAFTEPRINPPSLTQISDRLHEITWKDYKSVENDELLVFYHPETLAQIEGLRSWFAKRQEDGHFDQIDSWVRMVAVNRLTGHSSGFFSVYTLPPNQAVSVDRQRKINEKREQTPPFRDVPAIIAKKSKILLSQGTTHAKEYLFLIGQSHESPQIPDGSVSLTVTSPPFLDIVNYEADNWLRCWFLGIDPKSVKISKHRNADDWQAFVAATLKELARITRPGGHIAFEVGEVRNGTVRLEENVIAATDGLPLETLGVMINQQEFTKTSNCWGISNNKSGTNSNRIVLLKREE